jgi:flagellar basal-body rod modification protein FlgD
MSTIDNFIGGITPEPKPIKSYGDKSLDQSDFMTLLGAQLQHQDPMKPMENGEFIAEMAQFSALESANNLTDAFKQLSTTMLSSASLQASLLVGKTVSFASNSVNLAEQGANLSARNPASGIVSLEVRDETGAIVYSHSQMTEPGKYQHFWDGTGGVPGQQYQISLFNSTLEEDLQPEVQDKVKSVDVSGTDIAIKLALNGQIAQSNLIEIFEN